MSTGQQKKSRNQKKKLAVVSTIFIALVILFYVVMTYSGRWLVNDDEFGHVKWALVLDGQSADMERTDYIASLMTEGKVDSVLILGRRCLRNRNNAEFYVEDFMQQGSFDSSTVFIAAHDDPSTIGEAYTVIPWLKARNADTVLLVTSASATHRVKNIFSTLAGESPVFITADIHHYQYNPDSWYTNRESRKSWLREWAAYFISIIDLWPAGILTAADSSYYRPIVSLKELEQQKNPVVDLQALLPKTEPKIRKEESIADSATVVTPEQDSLASTNTETLPATKK
ncbi:MAG: YdcF family protein [Fibrobacter sp.]|nr:YdcF family protein [Fibrobacter sp.]